MKQKQEKVNLYNYFLLLKCYNDLAGISLEELTNYVNIKKFSDKYNGQIDVSLLRSKIVKSIVGEVIVDDNILNIEKIADKLTFYMKEISLTKINYNILKYRIVDLLVSNDDAIRLLGVDIYSINTCALNLIMNNIADKLGISIDFDKLKINDLNRLNNLTSNYYNEAYQNNDLFDNSYYFNLVRGVDIKGDVRHTKRIIKKYKKKI